VAPGRGVCHVEIAQKLNEAVLELFPVYGNLLALQLMFADGAGID
jgi:hypothetical protein